MRAHAQAHPHRGAGPRPRAWFWGGLVAAAAAALVLATIGASPGDAERASTSSDEAAAESPSTTSDRPAYLSADPRSDAAVQVQGTEVTWDVDGAVTAAFAVQHWSSSDEATRVSLGSQLVWEARAQLGRAPLPGEVVVVEWRTEDSSTRRLSWFAPDRRED